MRITSAVLIGSLLVLCSFTSEMGQENPSIIPEGKEIRFYTPDSIKIFGDLYELDKKGKTILLFHQGGSNARGEYAPIIPKLIEKGVQHLGH